MADFDREQVQWWVTRLRWDAGIVYGSDEVADLLESAIHLYDTHEALKGEHAKADPPPLSREAKEKVMRLAIQAGGRGQMGDLAESSRLAGEARRLLGLERSSWPSTATAFPGVPS